ncbi:protein kinase domain-containing protein [Cryptosporidium andersoni]|uniref:Protein kinase domain-containing protein n=1 Tax=Cryptosporidium andersoni TaxID=117008 RepID=A0A1J4MX42_9CRYT|nr:protein kinase domain-containing protein [Cryptosporidium andersoni]
MDWTSVIERDLRRLSELPKGDITGILAFLHHEACDGKLYRLVRSSFPFNLSSAPPDWGLCRPSEIPSTISLSLSYVYRNAVNTANLRTSMEWTEKHAELFLEATIVSCWSSLSKCENNSELCDLDIGTDLLNEISLQSIGQKDARIWGLWAVLDFLNYSRKPNSLPNSTLLFNAATKALQKIEQGRFYNAEPSALLTAVTTQFTSIIQKNKPGMGVSPVHNIVENDTNTHPSTLSLSSSSSASANTETSPIGDSTCNNSVKPPEQRATIRYVPSKRIGGRAHVFSLSSTTATTPAGSKTNDTINVAYSTQHNASNNFSTSYIQGDSYTTNSCDLKTPIPIRRQISQNEFQPQNIDNIQQQNQILNSEQIDPKIKSNKKIGFNIVPEQQQIEYSINEADISTTNRSNPLQPPEVCKYSLEPAVKYPGYKIEVNRKTYEILSSIQKGGSSQVYKVRECDSNNFYALKCVRVFTGLHNHNKSESENIDHTNKNFYNKNMNDARKSPGYKVNSERKSNQRRNSLLQGTNMEAEGEEIENEEEDENEEEQLLLMFTEEVNLLKKMRGCPHVIQLIDYEIALGCGAIDIVMELGIKDLNGILQGNSLLPSIQVLRKIWTEMVLALKDVHDLRIVHGDIKPANFVFVEDIDHLNDNLNDLAGNNGKDFCITGKKVKIIDFGISRPIADDTTHIFRDKAVGSLPFMAPETVRPVSISSSKFALAAASKLRMPNQIMSRTADIWSLGAILYRIVYKRHLFQPIQSKSKHNGSNNGGPPLPSTVKKNSNSSNKSNVAPHEILMFLQSDQGKIVFPKEIGYTFSLQSNDDKLWLDSLRNLLQWALQWDPANRPNVNQLLTHPFIDTKIVSETIFQFHIPHSLTIGTHQFEKYQSIEKLIETLSDNDRNSALDKFFKTPFNSIKGEKSNTFYSSMRWNIVTQGNSLFLNIYNSLVSSITTGKTGEDITQDMSSINQLAILQYTTLVKNIYIPPPPSTGSITASRKGHN